MGSCRNDTGGIPVPSSFLFCQSSINFNIPQTCLSLFSSSSGLPFSGFSWVHTYGFRKGAIVFVNGFLLVWVGVGCFQNYPVSLCPFPGQGHLQPLLCTMLDSGNCLSGSESEHCAIFLFKTTLLMFKFQVFGKEREQRERRRGKKEKRKNKKNRNKNNNNKICVCV